MRAATSVDTTGAVGFSVTGASFTMASVTKGTTSFTGVQATITNAALMGVAAVDLQVTGTVKLNTTSVLNGPRIDWDSATTVPSTLTNLIPVLAIDKAQQLAASGSASLNIGPGNVVAVITGFAMEMATADVVTGNAAITGLGATAGTIDGANVLTFTISGASLFVGTGATLGAGRTSVDTTGAVGFSVTGASFTMASVTKGTTSFTGVQATITNAALMGVAAVDLQVTGTVKLNTTSVLNGPRIDWDSATTVPSTLTNLIPVLAIDKAQQLAASGSASLNIGPGNVVAVITGFAMEMATADVVTGNAAITGLGATAGTIDGANVLTFTISGASLFVGTGATLGAGRTSVDTTGAVGFSVTGASFTMASVTKGTTSFTGVQATITNAALMGVAAVDLQVTGTVKLNTTSVLNGPRIDWDSATTVPSTLTNLIPVLAIDKAQQLAASGSASLNIGPGNVVAVITGFAMEMATADVVTGNAAITGLGATAGTIDGANVLTFTISGASLFVGTGATLGAGRTSVDTTGAVGFSVTGASFTMASVTKGTTSFTGVQATITNAALMGVAAVDLQVTGTVKLNTTSVLNGPRIDWDSATTVPSTLTNLIPVLAIDKAQQLAASGSASLNIGPGNVVAVITGFAMEMATADVVTGNAAITGLGATAGTIDGANVLTFTISGASLFVGTGATLGAGRTSVDTTGAVGFSVTGASFTMASVTKGTTSFTGVQATITNAALMGVAAVDLQVTGTVKLNTTSVLNGPRIDWDSATTVPSTLTNLIPVLAIDKAQQLAASGSASLNIGPGNVVAVITGFAMEMATADVVTGNAAITGLGATAGTIDGANVLTFTISGASLFVGTGATLGAGRTSVDTTGAVGFSVTGASFTMASVTKGTTSFTGVQATITNAALMGVAAVDLQVTGTVKLNTTSVLNGPRIDWDSATTVPSTLTNLIPVLAIDKAQQLAASGSASLNIGPGNVVAVITGFAMEMATADVVTGNAAITGLGATAGTIDGANVLTFTISGASLFVGTGATLGAGRTSVDTTGAVGFSVTGASFTMASVTKGTTSFTGVQATITNAALMGVAAVDLQVTGTVKLNTTSVLNGPRIDWDSATTVPSTLTNLIPVLAIDKAQQLAASGSASLNIGPGNVVAVITGFAMEMATADVVTGNAAITGLGATAGTIDGANVLTFTISGASLFVGTGATLGAGRTSVDTTGAVGFSVTGASFTMASVTKGTTSFTGVQATITNAALMGVAAVDLQVTGTVKLNTTSVLNGPRIDWDSATTVPSTLTNLIPVLAIDKAQQLAASGSASLNIGPGNVVAVITGFAMEMATADVVTGNAAITGLGATAGTIDGANVLTFTISGASLFVGTGATLGAGRTSVDTTGAVGFSVTGASFTMASVTKGTTSFTGVQATITNAALMGVAAVDLQVTGTVKLNTTSVLNGPRIDWDSATTVPSTLTNLIPVLAIDKAQQLAASGSASLNIGPGNVVAVITGFAMEMATADVVTGNAAITGLGATAGTIDGANVLTFTISGASLFVGTGATLGAGRTSVDTTGAVGFSVTGASFTMASVTKGTTSFTGVQATITNAALMGVAAVDLQVTGTVKLNTTSVLNGPRIDWDSATTVPSTLTNLIPVLAIDKAQQLAASGSASLNIGPGNVVAVITGFAMEMATADVVTGNAAITGLGATAGTIDGANVLTFTISGASLFVGTGATLGAGRTSVDTTGAVGFSVTGASFTMASVTKGTTSFTGVQATITNAALMGVAAVDLQVTGTVKLNTTSVLNGPRIDWDSATTVPLDADEPDSGAGDRQGAAARGEWFGVAQHRAGQRGGGDHGLRDGDGDGRCGDGQRGDHGPGRDGGHDRWRERAHLHDQRGEPVCRHGGDAGCGPHERGHDRGGGLQCDGGELHDGLGHEGHDQLHGGSGDDHERGADGRGGGGPAGDGHGEAEHDERAEWAAD